MKILLLMGILFVGANANDKIVNGEAANAGQFPYQASLQRSGSHFCGASLLSSTYLMTAAHCMNYYTSVDVVLGITDLETPTTDAGVVKTPALDQIRHPNYNATLIDYDYGLVRINPISLDLYDNIAPIQLVDKNAGDLTGANVITSGWGYIDKTLISSTGTDQLMWTQGVVLSNVECQSIWEGGITITERMLCMKGNMGNENSGVCSGDSGGPLVMQDDSGNYVLVGATSWSQRYCNPTFPNGWARLTEEWDWINDNAHLNN